MQTNLPRNFLTAAAAAAALCAPVAAQAKGPHGHGHGRDQGRSPAAVKAPRLANVIVKGTVAAVEGDVVTVDVARANRHGRALVGQQVKLDVSAARLLVRDVNQDGDRTAADVAAGDRVVAQLRVPRGAAPDLTQALATRRLLDVGPAPAPSQD